MNDDRTPRVLWFAALAVGLAVYAALPFPWPTNRFDTGIPLVAADRVLAGEWPYVDFQTLYTPGAYYVLAGAFAAFGRSFAVHVGVNKALFVLNGLALFAVAARLGGSRWRALPAVLAALVFQFSYPALTLVLFALLVARGKPVPTRGRVLAAGLLVGLAGFFRQDVGAAGGVALVAALAVGERGLSRARLRPAITGGAVALATIALLLSPALIANPGGVIDGLVLNPQATVVYREAELGLAGAFERHTAVALVVVVLALGSVGALALGTTRLSRNVDRRTDCGLLVGLGVMGLWAVRYFVLRPETHHVIPSGMLLGALAAARFRPSVGRLRLDHVWLAAVLAVFALPSYRQLGAWANQRLGRRKVAVVSLGDHLPGAGRIYVPAEEAPVYARLIGRIRELSAPGEPIFSACQRHDQIQDQDLLAYFLADRLPPVFDHHFDPGVTTRADVQEAMIRQLDEREVRLVVRFRSRNPKLPPGAPPGSPLLDDWLSEHFEPLETHGRYALWVRR